MFIHNSSTISTLRSFSRLAIHRTPAWLQSNLLLAKRTDHLLGDTCLRSSICTCIKLIPRTVANGKGQRKPEAMVLIFDIAITRHLIRRSTVCTVTVVTTRTSNSIVAFLKHPGW